jgi:ferric-dicitrate binding protein FerR (iron transport regulator)
MKERVKRTKAKSSSTRARTRPKPKRRKAAATKKSVLPKVKRVAKKAALAAGIAAIGTALSELQPEIKSGERDASHEDKSTRGKTLED